MSTFRTLDLAIEIYDRIEKAGITGHLRDQILRAGSSISLNLSEGYAKRSAKEKKRFYQTSYASLQECKTILRLAKCEDQKLINETDKLGAWLSKLLKSQITSKDFTKDS